MPRRHAGTGPGIAEWLFGWPVHRLRSSCAWRLLRGANVTDDELDFWQRESFGGQREIGFPDQRPVEYTAGFLGLHEARQDKELSGLPREFLLVVMEAIGDGIRDAIAGDPRRTDTVKLVIGPQGEAVVDDEIGVAVEGNHSLLANVEGRPGHEEGLKKNDENESGNQSDQGTDDLGFQRAVEAIGIRHFARESCAAIHGVHGVHGVHGDPLLRLLLFQA
ncbi:hypothetical protein CCP4SC76_3340003 [Gammaproteobacteria bacterium]